MSNIIANLNVFFTNIVNLGSRFYKKKHKTSNRLDIFAELLYTRLINYTFSNIATVRND